MLTLDDGHIHIGQNLLNKFRVVTKALSSVAL
jgi:hypothetical protein